MTWKGSGLSSWLSSSQVPKIKHFIPAHIVMIYPIWMKHNCCFIMKLVPLLTTVAGWMCEVRDWSWSWAKNSRRVFKTDGINNCNYTGRLLGLCTVGVYSRDSCLTFFGAGIIFLILAHPVYKIWITQEPNTLELWSKLHFEEHKPESIYHV